MAVYLRLQDLENRAEKLSSGRHRLSREYVANHQRERLLKAVLAVVGEVGYQGMSSLRVAQAAGVSSVTLYAHFDNALDCLLAAYDASLDWLLGDLEDTVAREPHWPVGVARGLAELLERLAAAPQLTRAWFVETYAVGEAGNVWRRAVLERLGRALAPRSGPSAGRLAQEMIAGGVWSAIQGAVADGSADDLSRLLPALLYHVLVYGAEPAQAAEAVALAA